MISYWRKDDGRERKNKSAYVKNIYEFGCDTYLISFVFNGLCSGTTNALAIGVCTLGMDVLDKLKGVM